MIVSKNHPTFCVLSDALTLLQGIRLFSSFVEAVKMTLYRKQVHGTILHREIDKYVSNVCLILRRVVPRLLDECPRLISQDNEALGMRIN